MGLLVRRQGTNIGKNCGYAIERVRNKTLNLFLLLLYQQRANGWWQRAAQLAFTAANVAAHVERGGLLSFSTCIACSSSVHRISLSVLNTAYNLVCVRHMQIDLCVYVFMWK